MRYSFFELRDVLSRGTCCCGEGVVEGDVLLRGCVLAEIGRGSVLLEENARWDCILAEVTGLLVQSPD